MGHQKSLVEGKFESLVEGKFEKYLEREKLCFCDLYSQNILARQFSDALNVEFSPKLYTCSLFRIYPSNLNTHQMIPK